MNRDAVLAKIAEVVGPHRQAFLEGACFHLFDVLRQAFPGARGMHDQVRGHVLTLIDGALYDATGEVPHSAGYVPLGKEPRAVSQLRREALRKLKSLNVCSCVEEL